MRAILAAPIAAALLFAAPIAPATADEISDTIESGLEAYRAGDLRKAKEEIDYAAQLLGQLKADGFESFVPDALAGWTRRMKDTTAAAAFGAGIFAGADYEKGGKTVTLQIIADSPIVASMSAIFANTALLATRGRVKRVKGVKFAIGEDEIMGLIANRVLIQISGTAAIEDKLAYLDRLDIDGLARF
jgi:hypothetical protein